MYARTLSTLHSVIGHSFFGPSVIGPSVIGPSCYGPFRFERSRFGFALHWRLLLVGLVAAVVPWSAIQPASGQQASNEHVKNSTELVTSQRSFEIPFSLNNQQASAVEVVLYHSTTEGQYWREYARRNPAAGKFRFQCDQDGRYGFAMQTIDRNGKKTPPRPTRCELIVVVDTEKPDLQFEVELDAAGRIVAKWIMFDQNFDSLKIEYQGEPTADGPKSKWHEVPMGQTSAAWDRVANQWYKQKTMPNNVRAFASPSQDQLAWWPQVNSQNIRVRATLADKAGHVTTVVRRITMPPAAGRAIPASMNSQQAARMSPRKPADPLPPNDARNQGYQPSGTPAALLPKQESNTNQQKQSSQRPPTIANRGNQTQTPQPPAPQNRLADRSTSTAGSKIPPSVSGIRANQTTWRSRTNTDVNVARVAQNSTQQWRSRGMQDNANHDSNLVVATGSTTGSAGQEAVNPAPRTNRHAGSNRQPAATEKTQATSNPDWKPNQITVPASYRVKNDDAMPAASSTMTSGPQFENLKQMAQSSNSTRFQLDYDVDAIGPEGVKSVELWVTKNGGNHWRRLAIDDDRRSPVDVQVDSQGIFGFRIVIVSNEGLKTRAPRRGDPADMWVNVDTTPPQARITAAPYGRGEQAGRLIIQWTANDANLAVRPIKLQFSPRSSGPWTTIEKGARNEGQYIWKPGPDIPDQVYLRMEVRDNAGNVQVHQLERAVDVSGLIPRGHIRKLTPLSQPDT